MKAAKIADEILGFETEFKVGFGLTLPLRMTALRTPQGVALISPIPIDDDIAMQIESLGPVTWLLAPNLMHHAYLADAKKRYPEARLLGPPGLSKKRSDLDFDQELGTGSLTDEIDTLLIDGAKKLSEVVFLHRPSNTLIVTDLVFNIRRASGMSKFMLSTVSKAFGKVEQSRLLRHLTNDREATSRSIDTLLRLPFNRVVMAHGEVVQDNAREKLEAGLWWMRGVSPA